MNAGLETYRGVVYQWEVDHNDHLTVAYYFARLGDATLALLDSLGLPSEWDARTWITADCYVRYTRELRAGDIMRVVSAPIAVERDGFVAGHELIDAGTGAVTTTFEQRLRHVRPDGAPAALAASDRERIEARRVVWDGPARERRMRPKGVDGLRDSARDTIRPWEAGGSGAGAVAANDHSFSTPHARALAPVRVGPACIDEQPRRCET